MHGRREIQQKNFLCEKSEVTRYIGREDVYREKTGNVYQAGYKGK